MLFGLLATTALAGPLEVPLGDRTGHIHVPGNLEVSLSFRGPADADTATWENNESSSLAFTCGEAKPASDDFSEQLLLQVGEEKWALAPGSSVKFACPEGKTASITDVHGTTVASWKGSIALNVTKAKPKAER